ncbi:MAG TPA: transcriptional regulator NanR [Acetobacteraceae bacterium]|nr:transcriptional regulator NanR [Acetobacteraceae bacterium]
MESETKSRDSNGESRPPASQHPVAADPIVRRKLSHEVFDRLVQAIQSGEFAPGERLPSERELMQRYGVGRPAIREAMQSLQGMGLIRIAHGERARVTLPTAAAIVDQVSGAMVQLASHVPGGLDELKDARLLLESGLAQVAAQRATPDGAAALRAALEECRQAMGDPARFVAADMAFHRQIAALSGNKLIHALSQGMLAWLTQFRRDLVTASGAERLTMQEHERITEAIVAGDAPAAAAAMRDHLTRANKLYAVLMANPAPPRRTRRPAQPPAARSAG